LFKGLQATGQDRLHQFVRSLEALILPDVGSAKKPLMHRGQTFALAGHGTPLPLQEANDMCCDTEHLHAWDRAVQNYPADQREDVCWHRTRHMEHLACDAYARLLRDAALREHFRTDATIASFWKLADDTSRSTWGTPLDIVADPLVRPYDPWQRAVV
jgi:hypothetical protein